MTAFNTSWIAALALMVSSFGIGVPNAEAANPKTISKIINNVVGLHWGDGRIRYDNQILVNRIEDDTINAYAEYYLGNVSVNFFEGLLREFTEDEVVIVVCHELGHLLGDMPAGAIGFNPIPSDFDPLSIEGEADYFAGKCAVGYYMDIEGLHRNSAQEKAFFAAASMFNKLYDDLGVPVEAQRAESSRYPGVNGDYPEPDCRLLSVWNGVEDLPRPKCWYNP